MLSSSQFKEWGRYIGPDKERSLWYIKWKKKSQNNTYSIVEFMIILNLYGYMYTYMHAKYFTRSGWTQHNIGYFWRRE